MATLKGMVVTAQARDGGTTYTPLPRFQLAPAAASPAERELALCPVPCPRFTSCPLVRPAHAGPCAGDVVYLGSR